jgi:ATP-dependent protease HslVU (ClpYQ) peptidase subunit
MTTIAYRDGVMAADSKATADASYRCSDVDKMRSFKNGAWLVGAAGDTMLIQYAFEHLEPCFGRGGTLKDLCLLDLSDLIASDTSLENAREEFELLIAHPKSGRCWFAGLTSSGMLLAYELKGSYHALGSGASLALVAMDCGRGAEKAVYAACKRDEGTAEPVVVLRGV